MKAFPLNPKCEKEASRELKILSLLNPGDSTLGLERDSKGGLPKQQKLTRFPNLNLEAVVKTFLRVAYGFEGPPKNHSVSQVKFNFRSSPPNQNSWKLSYDNF